jgi:hypothetical protein
VTVSRRRRWAGVACIAIASTTALCACGVGGDDAASEPNREYCRLANELDQQEDFPSAPQLEAYRDAAPEEIAGSVALVVDRFLGAIEVGDATTAYSDPAVERAFSPIEAYEAEHCGIEERP